MGDASPAARASPPAHIPPLAVSMGDPAGIGLEIILKAWTQRRQHALPAFVVYGDARALSEAAARLNLEVPVRTVGTADAVTTTYAEALPVLSVPLAAPALPGKPDPANAPATISAIERAVADTVVGATRAIVTCPISKSVLYAAGFTHPGHTEFLAHLAARHAPGHRWQPVMMLAGPMLRVVPVTVHMALRDVPARLTAELIQETVRITHAALVNAFNIPKPRIAVAGLNPHAGEDGSMGREEIEIITPALRALKHQGIEIIGPLPADTMFHAAARARYDAAVCMYHDQALIPLKTLAFDDGVNVTLGLPFVRTSPDHGTAFDIAGTGRANPASFIAALRLADTLSHARVPQAGAR